MRRFLLLIWIVLALVQVTLGGAWVAQNLGDTPTYSDTAEYLSLAQTLEVDAYRGVGYPASIAAVDRLVGGTVEAAIPYLQILQLLAGLSSLIYFLHVLDGATSVARSLARSELSTGLMR